MGPPGNTGPAGPPASSGGGDMLKSVYDTNVDNILDRAALANAVPWGGITGSGDISSCRRFDGRFLKTGTPTVLASYGDGSGNWFGQYRKASALPDKVP